MSRFFVSSDFKGKEVFIDGVEAHHMINVKRFKLGDRVSLFNGNGIECFGKIIDIFVNGKSSEKKVRIGIEKVECANIEIATEITMAFSVPKGKRSEIVVQKCSELGVKNLVPIIAERSIIRSNFDNKLEKWQKITIEASKQCGRNCTTNILDVLKFNALGSLIGKHDLSIMFSLDSKSRRLKDVIKEYQNVNSVLCIIGPEGGFTQSEIKKGEEFGCNFAKLTSQVLRIETAVIAVASMLIYEYAL